MVDLGIYFTPMIFINGVELEVVFHPVQFVYDDLADRRAAIESGADDGSVQQPPSATEKYILDWKQGRRIGINEVDHAPSFGAADPAVDVVVWVEYGSDFMSRAEEQLQPLLKNNDDLRLTYRVYPVSNECNPRVSASITRFPQACITARAAKAAAMAGGAEGARRFHNWLLGAGTSISGEGDLMAGLRSHPASIRPPSRMRWMIHDPWRWSPRMSDWVPRAASEDRRRSSSMIDMSPDTSSRDMTSWVKSSNRLDRANEFPSIEDHRRRGHDGCLHADDSGVGPDITAPSVGGSADPQRVQLHHTEIREIHSGRFVLEAAAAG